MCLSADNYTDAVAISEAWVKTNKPDQTACGVRLQRYRHGVLGLRVFFCSVGSCSKHQGWMPKSTNKTFRKKMVKDWAQHEYHVDSHSTQPDFSGRVTGMRLYLKAGRLAIGLRTDFYMWPK